MTTDRASTIECLMSFPEVLLDNNLLGPWFSTDSWRRWRAVLAASFGEGLNTADTALFHEVAEREAPTARVRELWAICGRGAGKDSIASAIAIYLALFHNYNAILRPGERASILCLACDREQAAIVHRYIRGYLDAVPLLKRELVRDTADALIFKNNAEIVIATNSFRAVRGRSIAAAVLDEVAFFRDEASAAPDVELYHALKPGLLRVPGSMLIGISTPYRRSGLLWEKFKEAYGQDGDVLVIRAPSITMNPTLDQAAIEREIAKDPAAASAEWLAEWRTDVDSFVNPDVVAACTERGCHELPPLPGISYAGFVDPSGGSADSFTLAIAHATRDGKGVLDLVREVRPPFSPDAVTERFAEDLLRYRLNTVMGDRYGGEWPGERFKTHGVTYTPSERSKSEIYLELLPLLNAGRVQLLDNTRLINQLCGLERRTFRGGRDSVDHPHGSHDDVANAVAGVLVQVAGKPPLVESWLRYKAGSEAFMARMGWYRTAAPRPLCRLGS